MVGCPLSTLFEASSGGPYRDSSPSSNAVRRSARRNPNPESDRNEDDEDDDSIGKRREKKLKLVLRLPPRSSSANSRGGGSDDGSYRSDDSNGETPMKKRKINAVAAGDGSRAGEGGFGSGSGREKAERYNSGLKATEPLPGTPLEGPGTPLPDKKLLVFILDRLQKKDTYGVFSDPVDHKELPDYHEVIEHPMDFGTVRKKLSSGAYASLEQFEKDVFLISSNAMRYNAPDTIYFRQARSIQELAKKDFENLRQDSEDNEPEMKTVRRGRPPGKSSIKRLGRPPFERAGSDFSSDATLANAGDNSIWSNSTHDFSRKAQLSDKSGTTDVLARTSRNGENHGWAERKSDRNDDFPGSVLKGMSRFGKKPFVFDENRRNTYKLSQQSSSGSEPSVLTTFDGEKKQLMAVGVHVEHSYVRSLARFAAQLGPVAWKVASKKIEKALPSGMKFGPGWVGENEAPQMQFPLLSTSPPRQPLPPSQNPSLPKISSYMMPQVFESKGERLSEKQVPLSSATPPQQQLPPSQNSSQTKIASYNMPHVLESRGEKLSEKQELLNDSPSDAHPNRALPASTSTSAVTNRSGTPEGADTIRGINYGSGFSLLSSGGGFRPKPPFQLSQNPTIHSPSPINGFNSGYGFNIASQVGKLVGVGPARQGGNFVQEASMPSRLINMVPRSSNNSVHPTPTNHLEAEDSKPLAGSSSINLVVDSGPEGQTRSGAGLRSPPSWRGKSDSVPPDLNVRFQSPGSPTSGMSQQPDLALQL
ncbi:hypothetical protein MRB53_034186 [Persea americana]|uniref:Uncharacterized protein n=1 Tax=Persea americana TaxID=3435 RepID=A0ACC2KXN7_PERAE|nr:hypothetical protein MRB53_034186 [Persea americana]